MSAARSVRSHYDDGKIVKEFSGHLVIGPSGWPPSGVLEAAKPSAWSGVVGIVDHGIH
jgi:hypothetical protein